jgi:hypothetical protein
MGANWIRSAEGLILVMPATLGTIEFWVESISFHSELNFETPPALMVFNTIFLVAATIVSIRQANGLYVFIHGCALSYNSAHTMVSTLREFSICSSCTPWEF